MNASYIDRKKCISVGVRNKKINNANIYRTIDANLQKFKLQYFNEHIKFIGYAYVNCSCDTIYPKRSHKNTLNQTYNCNAKIKIDRKCM